MKCKECEAEGLRSTVQAGVGTTTGVYVAPFYDEDGVYHDHDPNVITASYSCSNGHTWTASTRSPCPAPGCDYGRAAEAPTAQTGDDNGET